MMMGHPGQHTADSSSTSADGAVTLDSTVHTQKRTVTMNSENGEETIHDLDTFLPIRKLVD